jgi:hypothetical protein
LMQDGHEISESAFREQYVALFHSDDFERLARERLRGKNEEILAIAGGLTLASIGGLTAMALVSPGPCPRTRTDGGVSCDNAVAGGATLVLLGGVGLYALGCEAIKGIHCLLDGTFGPVSSMSAADATTLVDRYNDALATASRSRTSVESKEPARESQARSKPDLMISPFGVAGRF